jgi:hypothetical protein
MGAVSGFRNQTATCEVISGRQRVCSRIREVADGFGPGGSLQLETIDGQQRYLLPHSELVIHLGLTEPKTVSGGGK